MGRPKGKSGSLITWSTPAPKDRIAFKFGYFLRIPLGCFQTTAYSTSLTSPSSGYTLILIYGIASSRPLRQTSMSSQKSVEANNIDIVINENL